MIENQSSSPMSGSDGIGLAIGRVWVPTLASAQACWFNILMTGSIHFSSMFSARMQLTPNAQYIFKIACRNLNGLSLYSDETVPVKAAGFPEDMPAPIERNSEMRTAQFHNACARARTHIRMHFRLSTQAYAWRTTARHSAPRHATAHHGTASRFNHACLCAHTSMNVHTAQHSTCLYV